MVTLAGIADTHDRPKARTEHLVSEWIGDELVIYDQLSQTAHCLSADVPAVWELCDGSRSEREIADELRLAREAVARAVAALDDRGLLADRRLVDERPPAELGYSRREAAFRLAKVGGAAVAAPLIYSVNVGSAAAAASHLAAGCPVSVCGSCTGIVSCLLCQTLGAVGTSSACASGKCYCSSVTSSGGSQAALRCAIGGTSCRGDGASCSTGSECCGNACVSSKCRPAAC